MNFNKKNRGEYRYYIENEEDISPIITIGKIKSIISMFSRIV